ncbi:DNA adenine methylase [Idiomarina abyssalis]|uniref:DNA adenine methylase n=1 Tax=Idiomarina abyssalis TaxID=86102 RepID=UPI003A8CBE90
MSRTASPLRYPGGKSVLKPLVSEVIKSNGLVRCHYAEPYAGGCGLALSLLYSGLVSDIHINDLDKSIWSFWHSILNDTDRFIGMIESTDVTFKEWEKQKEIQANSSSSDIDFLTLGFSTFFLNRTNRSGIIKGAGAIGGNSQSGNYKIDCRFNKKDLISRIQRVEKYKKRIHLTNFDAIDFMEMAEKELPARTFFCIDPPYFKKGSSLYTSFYKKQDHSDVSKAVATITQPWLVTYDNVAPIRELYSKFRQFPFNINYSVQTKRVGTELMIASKGLRVPMGFQKTSHALLKAAS